MKNIFYDALGGRAAALGFGMYLHIYKLENKINKQMTSSVLATDREQRHAQ